MNPLLSELQEETQTILGRRIVDVFQANVKCDEEEVIKAIKNELTMMLEERLSENC